MWPSVSSVLGTWVFLLEKAKRSFLRMLQIPPPHLPPQPCALESWAASEDSHTPPLGFSQWGTSRGSEDGRIVKTGNLFAASFPAESTLPTMIEGHSYCQAPSPHSSLWLGVPVICSLPSSDLRCWHPTITNHEILQQPQWFLHTPPTPLWTITLLNSLQNYSSVFLLGPWHIEHVF